MTRLISSILILMISGCLTRDALASDRSLPSQITTDQVKELQQRLVGFQTEIQKIRQQISLRQFPFDGISEFSVESARLLYRKKFRAPYVGGMWALGLGVGLAVLARIQFGAGAGIPTAIMAFPAVTSYYGILIAGGAPKGIRLADHLAEKQASRLTEKLDSHTKAFYFDTIDLVKLHEIVRALSDISELKNELDKWFHATRESFPFEDRSSHSQEAFEARLVTSWYALQESMYGGIETALEVLRESLEKAQRDSVRDCMSQLRRISMSQPIK